MGYKIIAYIISGVSTAIGVYILWDVLGWKIGLGIAFIVFGLLG